MDSPHLDEFDASLEGWTDERFISRQDLRAVAMFAVYLVNLLGTEGATYDGHSLTIKTPMCLLVVRGTIDGVPHIVFTSGRTPTACTRIFMRKLEEGLLEWRPDKFRS